jgi:hypothetical protein
MVVAGRVVDPEGKPVSDATIMVYAHHKAPGRGGEFDQGGPAAIGQTRVNSSGGFHLETTRTSSSRYYEVGAVALAPGFGTGWVDLSPDAEQPIAEIRLLPEQIIHGRLVDIQGQPAPGVQARVQVMGRIAGGNLEGLHFWGTEQALPAWPAPVTTDAQGRFTLRGIGRGLMINLVVVDEQHRFARQFVQITTDDAPGPKHLTLVLEPAKIITGRVRYADTGQPVTNAVLSVAASETQFGSMYDTSFRADADGRFRLNPTPGNYFRVSAHAPPGQPYLIAQKEFAWTKGKVEHIADIALRRGVLIRGKVTEASSGNPIEGTTVEYHPYLKKGVGEGIISGWPGTVSTASDGTYQIAVMPRPGHLVYRAPNDDYVLQAIGQLRILQDLPGGRRFYAHAFVAYDMKTGSDDRKIDVALQRGMAVKGMAVGPDGRPIPEGMIISRAIIAQLGRVWNGDYKGIIHEGHFELHGLAPDTEVPFYFLDPSRKLGATVNLSGKSGRGGTMTVRLEPCGTAQARLIDPQGKPVPNYSSSFLITIVVTPGPSGFRRHKANEGRLVADEGFLCNIDRANYWISNGPRSDAQGRITLPALIPGALYRLHDLAAEGKPDGVPFLKEFSVKPGELTELGDIRIEGPSQSR